MDFFFGIGNTKKKNPFLVDDRTFFPKSILIDRSKLYNKGAGRASSFGPKLSYYSSIRNRFRVFPKSILIDRFHIYNKEG